MPRRLPALHPPHSPAPPRCRISPALSPSFPQSVCTPEAPTPPPAPLLHTILSVAKHLPGTPLSPCPPRLPPPGSTEPQSGGGGTPGQPPHHGHWPGFSFLSALRSLLWWRCSLLPMPCPTEAALPGDPAKEPGQTLNLCFPCCVCKMGIKASSQQAS